MNFFNIPSVRKYTLGALVLCILLIFWSVVQMSPLIYNDWNRVCKTHIGNDNDVKSCWQTYETQVNNAKVNLIGAGAVGIGLLSILLTSKYSKNKSNPIVI